MFLETLRTKVGKVILWLLVLAFLGWVGFDLGADMVGGRIQKPWERGVIAEVDGHEISYELYRMRLEKAIQDSIRARGGKELSREDEARIEELVWQELLDDMRWERVLKERGLRLSDDVVLRIMAQFPPKEIREDTAFWREGRFDYDLYLQILSDPRNLEYFKTYEMELRRTIPRDFMRFDLMTSVSVSKREAFLKYKIDETTADLEYFAVNSRVAVPDSEVHVSEEEIKKFYEEHKKEKYWAGPRAKLVVVRVTKLPSPADTAQAVEKLKIALEELHQGTPFEEVVKYYSEDEMTAERGGDMGWVKLEVMPPKVREAVEKADTGIVGPVQSPLGFHLFKIVEKSGDSVHLKQVLAKVHLTAETEQRLADSLREVLDYAKDNKKSLSEAAEALGFKADTVGPFDLEKGFVPMLGSDPELVQMVQEAKPGYISPLIRKPTFYAVFQVLEKFPEGPLPLEEVKDRVKRDLIKIKKREKLLEKAKAWVEDLKAGREPQLPPGGTYRRDTAAKYARFLPGVGDKEVFWGKVFKAKPGEVVGPFAGEVIVYGFKLYSKREPTWDEFKPVADAKARALRSYWFQRLFTGWQDEFRKGLKVKDYRPFIFAY